MNDADSRIGKWFKYHNQTVYILCVKQDWLIALTNKPLLRRPYNKDLSAYFKLPKIFFEQFSWIGIHNSEQLKEITPPFIL